MSSPVLLGALGFLVQPSLVDSDTTGPGCSKPGLARILISNLQLFGVFFCLYCLSFSFEFEQSQTIQNISSEKHFQTRKINTSVNF